MAGHSAIDAEAEANYAKQGLGSGLSLLLVALKVARNLAFGSQEMVDRSAVFEWSYQVKTDHLVTAEGDRFSKLIATERPLQRAILESVEKDFVNDPSVRQKIVVSVDSPADGSPDAQRRSYIYVYTRHGNEIKAQSIESFADAKSLRALLKHLGCSNTVRGVEDGKVLIEPTSMRKPGDCLTLERVSAATRLVSETLSRTERSQDLAHRLKWYVENREFVKKALEADTQRRAEELMKGGLGKFVEATRAQANALNRVIEGGQARAKALFSAEHKDSAIPKEYVRVSRPEGLSVVGIDARLAHSASFDRISVLGWGNMARWAELLGLPIPNKNSDLRASERSALVRSTVDTRGRGSHVGSSIGRSLGINGSKRHGVPPLKEHQERGARNQGTVVSAIRARASSAPSQGLRVGASQRSPLIDTRIAQVTSYLAEALTKGGFSIVRLSTSEGRVVAHSQFNNKTATAQNALRNKNGIVFKMLSTKGGTLGEVSRLRTVAKLILKAQLDRFLRRDSRIRGDSRGAQGLGRLTQGLRRLVPFPRSLGRPSSLVLRIGKNISAWSRLMRIGLSRRATTLRGTLADRMKALKGSLFRSMTRVESCVRVHGALRLRASQMRSLSLASRIRIRGKGQVLGSEKRRVDSHRVKGVLSPDSRGMVLVFVEWLLRQIRAPRSRKWFMGVEARVQDVSTSRSGEVEAGGDDFATREIRTGVMKESTDLPDGDTPVQKGELQESAIEEPGLFIAAEPRWELSIFTAQQFDSCPPEAEAASFTG